MGYTSQLKTTVDLPVWEWMRFAQTAPTAISAMTTAGQGDNRYTYYLVSNTFARYDSWSDGWQVLTGPAQAQAALTPASQVSLKYNSQVGYYGRVLSATSTTLTCAALTGQALKGYTIRIISGTGMGQERTITGVSDPTIADTFIVTTNGLSSATDSTKTWKSNRWVGYQVRFINGTGAGQVRKILHNSSTVITWANGNHYVLSPWIWGATLLTNTTANSTFGVIESSVVTVDSPWTITPDSTSEFMVLSGGVFMTTAAGTSTGITFQYYDVLADVWYQRMSPVGLFGTSATNGPSATLDSLSEFTQSYTTGSISTVNNATYGYFTDSSQSLSVNKYAGYAARIISGSGLGQSRTIIANSASFFYVNRPWSGSVDTSSVYSITNDYDKLFATNNNTAYLAEHSIELDMWSMSTIYDYGVARSISARKNGYEPFAVTGIVRATGGILAVNATPTAGGSGYRVDDILTCSTGGTLGRVRVLTIDANGGVLSIALENPGSTYTTGTGKATTGGTGSGCTINITSIGDVATATTAIQHTIMIGDTVTIAGTVQSDYTGSKTILGADTTTTFAYSVSNTPATPATFNPQTTLLLVDQTKNWAVNEHVGKYLLATDAFTSNNAGAASLVKITSNNSSSIVLFSTASIPSGITKYAIVDMKFFGTDTVQPFSPGEGFATSGSTTTLTDTTKNWTPNVWNNKKIRIIAGTGIGQETAITSSTATTITILGTWTSPDSSSVYSIEDCYGVISSSSTTTMGDNTQTWPTNYFVNKSVKFVTGTAAQLEPAITQNTSTVLTFTAITAGPTVGTPYAIYSIPPRGASTKLIHAFNQTDTINKGRYLFSFRGGASAGVDRYNLSTQRWDWLLFTPNAETLDTGTMYVYDGQDRIYITRNATGRVFCFDVNTIRMDGYGIVPYGMSTAIIGNRMEIVKSTDGLKYLYIMRHSGTEFWRTLLWI